ncbi:MAG TPA: biotin/lipoyl-containing protein, partial [Candidatus Binatia bacterium]|nr:biotin/lipoyl-containing protein [Candidatus Binatia bacterium]
MPRPFALPDLGEGLTEAEIVKVFVNEGDVIAEDAPLLEVETDKATVEIPSPFGGRVASIHIQPGQTVKVGEVLITFDDATLAPAGRGGGATLPKPENDDRFRQGRPT